MKRTFLFLMLVALLAAMPAEAKTVKKVARKAKAKQTATVSDLTKGVEALNNEDYATASNLLNKYTAAFPTDANGWVYLAALKSDLDQPEEALAAMDKARQCRIDENNADFLNYLYYTRSTINLQLNDTLSAIEDLNMALRYNDKDFDCYVRRGNLYKRLNRLDEAMVDYGYMVQLNKNYVEGYLGLGTIAGKQGKRKDAIKAYSMAIKLEPDLADPYAMRAVEYYNDWDYSKAAKDVIEALERDKDNARALWLLQYLQKDAPDAVQKEFKAKAKKTKDPSWLDLIK